MPPANPIKSTHFMPRPGGDATTIAVPGEIKQCLPAWAYTAGHLAADVLAMFERASARGRLRQAVDGWEAAALAGRTLNVSAPWARRTAARYFCFYRRFPRSKLFRDLLAETAGDDGQSKRENPGRAAQAFLALLADQLAAEVGGGFREDKLCRVLERLGGDQRGMEIPFAPPGGGPQAGTAHLALQYRVAQALPQLLLQYEPASRRHTERRPTPWPADDIDIRRMRSWGAAEVAGVIAQDLVVTDGEFYQRFAERSLRVVEHQEVRPQPRRIELLIDVSGSMEGTRQVYAIASAVALLSNALRGANTATIRCFDAAPHEPIAGRPSEVVQALLRQPFSGGGTSIDNALHAVDPSSDEVILITDGEDAVTARPAQGVTVYHCVDTQSGNRAAGLRRLGKYHAVRIN